MIRYRPCTFLILAILTGCSMKPSQGPTKSSEQTAKADPWPGAAAILRRQPDLGGARQAISLLTTELVDNPNATVPPAMPEDAARTLGERLRLTPDETRDLASANFTNLDAAYIVECLILRDAIRSLDLGSLTAERKCRLVFDWTCRQIYLRQGRIRTPQGLVVSPALPPEYALYRGYGTAMDRSIVFLSALRQLGLDGCLIGPPDRENTPGPFWAVGVRMEDGRILLFDPARGHAYPGPDGTVGTLAQATSGSAALKAWRDDKENPWTITDADLKSATAYVALPYVAASLRMKLLESKIGTELGLKVFADPLELLGRIGPNAKLWSPATNRDPFCLTRLLPSFLPVGEGGTDRPPVPELGLQSQTLKFSTVPIASFSPPPEITVPEVNETLSRMFEVRYEEMVGSSNGREKIARGQFNEVIRTAVERERKLDEFRDRARGNVLPPDAVAKWLEEAKSVYEQLSLARLPRNAADLPAAEAARKRLWEQGGAVLQLVDDRTIAPVCRAELAYLLAVCKHEQAERTSIRLGRLAEKDAGRPEAAKAAAEAWPVAKDAWDRYLAAAEPFRKAEPERAAHAKFLADRAARRIANPAAE